MAFRAAWLVLLGAVGCGRVGFDVSELGGDGGGSDEDALVGKNVVFVASSLTTGGIGGLAQADAICAQRATEAGLAGTYVAYLSTTTVNAVDRLAGARGWVRPDGKPFADTAADIAAGRLLYPSMLDEYARPVSADPVLTGTLLDGTVALNQNCADYTRDDVLGSAGDPYDGTVSFSRIGNYGCDAMFHIYCFGTDLDAPIEQQPVGRLAFTARWDNPTTGLGAADQVCRTAATNAGLSGSFRALLGTSTASAASRFNAAGPNWTRHDGLPLAPTPEALLSGTLELPVARDASGTPGGEFVFTGGPPSMPAASSCSDWTSSSGNGAAGRSSYAGDPGFDGTALMCFVSYGAVYCLEE